MKTMEENKGKDELLKLKKKKIVCHFCNKKLKLHEQIKCCCDHYFCLKHMNRHSHNCTFDMKTKRKEELKKNNPKMGEKIIMVQ
tara:strand:- start:3034 stop:3285 length:252 start_codon:yes stop_codon:yes gene_type:complete